MRVPGEQEGAYVTKVDVLFPAGFTGVDYENVARLEHAGRSKRKLATPITEGRGNDRHARSRRSSGPGPGRSARSNNGQFINFPLSLAIPEDAAGKALEFRTVQTYSNGQVVHWIEPSLTAEHPSPRINVTAKGGLIEEVAGHEAGPEAGQTGAGASASRPRQPRSPARAPARAWGSPR